MHIKKVIIEGFKTYKQRTEIDEFDAGVNVIMGKNGSGKSNIFEAIQFVLSDKYSNLRTEERQRLLHEGSGRDVLTASVEIIFDNSDMRFPNEKDTISLKRTIGLKKDEYFMDGKHMSKSDVVNLLESAGLSRSNPYYIVQQGKVASLIKMKDSERLETLKEIAGTKTYDERRDESVKIMQNTDKQLEQIQEVIDYIEKRLVELDEEKSELKEYQELDADRRCLEFTIYDKKLRSTTEQLEAIETSRSKSNQASMSVFNEANELKQKRQDMEDEMKKLTEGLTSLKSKKSEAEMKRNDLRTEKTKAELKVQSQRDAISSEGSKLQSAKKELQEVSSRLKAATEALEKIKKDFDVKNKNEQEAVQRLAFCEQRLVELHAKQSRTKQFGNKAARDKFLKDQLKEVEDILRSSQKQLEGVTKEEKELKASAARTTKALEAKQNELMDVKQQLDQNKDDQEQLKKARDTANNKRKSLWQQEQEFDKSGTGVAGQLEKAKRSLMFSIDKSLYRGVEAVKRIAKEMNLVGMHGPVIELFQCDMRFHTCVESTAGSSLFHVVVDSVQVANQLVEALNKTKEGRVTFIPLNQIHDEHIPEYPNTTDVLPMIQKLSFDAKYSKAIAQIFGRTLIAKDLAIASQYARSHGFDTITLAGDKVNKKGALTGGFVDFKSSKLQAMAEIKKLMEESRLKEDSKQKITDELQQADQDITKLLGEFNKERQKRDHLHRKVEQVNGEMKALVKEGKVMEEALANKTKLTESLKQTISGVEKRLDFIKNELTSDFSDRLSAAEAAELHAYTAEVTTLKTTIVQKRAERADVEVQKTTLEQQLSTNLTRRQEELAALLSSPRSEEAKDLLDADLQELITVSEQTAEAERSVTDAEKRIDGDNGELRNMQAELETLKSEEAALDRKVAGDAKSIEQLINRRGVLLQTKEDCGRKIRELGSLPSTAFSKYVSKNEKQLMSMLIVVIEKLKKYSHVNKKAIDQYVAFKEQREQLMERKDELDKGRTAILDLIEDLDMKKEEAISRTFKAIAKHFSTVFSELVPGGKGTLVIHTKKSDDDEANDDDEGDDNDDEEEMQENVGRKRKNSPIKNKGGKKAKVEKKNVAVPATKQYTGVSFSVSFSGGKQITSQLSGGQQSVVALSLVFAIQRCDPSPFYVFDEIDANLDAVHRTAVANMLKKQKSTTQFVCTTFRPEFLDASDKEYGVVFANKCSKVSVIQKDQAKQLILIVEKEQAEASEVL